MICDDTEFTISDEIENASITFKNIYGNNHSYHLSIDCNMIQHAIELDCHNNLNNLKNIKIFKFKNLYKTIKSLNISGKFGRFLVVNFHNNVVTNVCDEKANIKSAQCYKTFFYIDDLNDLHVIINIMY